MLPSETMIWQPEFTDKTLSRKPGAVQFPDKNVDDICRSVLKKHRETVTLMGFTPTHLSLAIGMLNGVFKER
ncbi:cell division protein ZapA [Escherichia coli]|uniref:cell division protein ZapA n=1 Tax=Escherichia coli TaxID=562 RepID=UPI003D359D7B